MEERSIFFLLIFSYMPQRSKSSQVPLTRKACLHHRQKKSVIKKCFMKSSSGNKSHDFILQSKLRWGSEAGEEISVLQGMCNNFLSYSANTFWWKEIIFWLWKGKKKTTPKPINLKTPAVQQTAEGWQSPPPDICTWQLSLISKSYLRNPELCNLSFSEKFVP